MAENAYEGMFILDSGRYGRDPEAVSGQISQMIERAGGQMLVSRLWEERRLAFSIKGHRRGTYWLTYFRLDSSKLAPIERQCQLNETILRKLFLKVDPRIFDALVAHAQTAADPGAREDEDKKAPEDKDQSDEGEDTAAKDLEKSDLSKVADPDNT